MKIAVKTSELARTAALAAGVADKRSPVAAARMVRLVAKGSVLTLSAFDAGRLSLTGGIDKCDATTPKEGDFAVDANALAAAVKSLNAEDTTVSSDGKRLTIWSGTSRLDLPCHPGNTVPLPSVNYERHKLDMAPAGFGAALKRVAYPVNPRDGAVPPSQQGVIFDSSIRDTLSLTGVDGHRLGHTSIECTLPAIREIIPLAAVNRIIAATQDEDDSPHIGVQDKQFICRSGRVTIFALVIDAQLMPVDTVLANCAALRAENVATVARAELVSAVRLAALVSERQNDKSPDRFFLAADAANLTVSCSNATLGYATTAIPSATKCNPVRVSVTWQYLLDALEHIRTDDVEVLFGPDALSPIVLRPRGDEKQIHMIMVRHGG